MKIKIIKMNDTSIIPTYAKSGDAGFDLVINNFKKIYGSDNESSIPDEVLSCVILKQGERLLCGTGLKMEIPDGFELQVRSRSGSTLKYGVVVANSPGTIDSGYRGEIGLILLNTSPVPMYIYIGDSMAQGVLSQYIQTQFLLVEEISESDRGEGGYGSTNKVESKL